MGDLRRNFDRREFACPCCGEVVVKDHLADALQQLRDNVGRPVVVTSGYRCEKHNREKGGTENSQHLKGAAADVYVHGYGTRDTYHAAIEVAAFQQGGIGVYPKRGIVHVDVRGYPARWGGPVNGRYTSLADALHRLRTAG